MAAFITSADAIFVLTIDTLFNAPITLENWSADRAWEAAAIEQVQTRMSIDGKLNAGWVPNPVDMTLNIQPNSLSIPVFEALQTAQATARTPYQLGAEITLPGLKRKYTLTTGYLVTGSVMPAAGRLLEERSFTLRWERVIGLGI
ncbi:phage tail fiber protein [Asaia prunellae]|uniref:phage tail fiber protein n=1 Tax=Asaia prunellae TaxID=610245 RepID=UPI0004714A98|nr:hypothetical protein [Asaia prunellae]